MTQIRLSCWDICDNLEFIRDKLEKEYDRKIDTEDDYANKVAFKREKVEMTESVSKAINAVKLISNIQNFNSGDTIYVDDCDEAEAKFIVGR